MIDVAQLQGVGKPRVLESSVLLHGGSDHLHGIQFPGDSVPIWENKIGWGNKTARLWCELNSFEGNNPGLKFQVANAKRIQDAGGYVVITLWGTPASLATVPLDQTGYRNRRVYHKYPPSDFEAWADMYVSVVEAFVKELDVERIWFELWLEPARFYWRGDDQDFFDLVSITQRKVREWEAANGIRVKFGGFQLSDVGDHALFTYPWMATPTWDHFQMFLDRAKAEEWQLDFMAYYAPSNRRGDHRHFSMTERARLNVVERMRSMLDRAGYEHTIIGKNETTPGIQIGYEGIPSYPALEQDCEIGAAQQAAMVRWLWQNGVAYTDWDFLQTGRYYGIYHNGPPLGGRRWPFSYGGSGMLTYLHQYAKPRFTTAMMFKELLSLSEVLELRPPLKKTAILTASPDRSLLRLLIWNYTDEWLTLPSHQKTYQSIRRQFTKGLTLEPNALFSGYRLSEYVMLDSSKNNSWSYWVNRIGPVLVQLSQTEDLTAALKAKSSKDKFTKKLQKLLEGLREFDSLKWDDATDKIYLGQFSVCLMEFVRDGQVDMRIE